MTTKRLRLGLAIAGLVLVVGCSSPDGPTATNTTSTGDLPEDLVRPPADHDTLQATVSPTSAAPATPSSPTTEPNPSPTEPPPTSTPLSLPDVAFDRGSAELTEEGTRLLTALFPQLLVHRVVLVEGHTSEEDSDAANLTLSIDRANAVRMFLLSLEYRGQQLAPDTVHAIGHGECQPITPHQTTEADRQVNRRVTITSGDLTVPPQPAGPC